MSFPENFLANMDQEATRIIWSNIDPYIFSTKKIQNQSNSSEDDQNIEKNYFHHVKTS